MMTPHDFEKLLTFFQDLYAHAETLREMMEKHPDDLTQETYEELHPRQTQLAQEKFQMFFFALNEPEAFAKAVREFLDTNPKKHTVH